MLELRPPMPHEERRAYRYIAIGLVAGSMLMHEILLTRICALRLQFHFAFLVISNCLLGLGASGTLLTVYKAVFEREPRAWIGRFTLGYALSLIGTYVVLHESPLPPQLDTSNMAHLFALTSFNLAGALPFLAGGCVVGMLLTFDAANVHRLYAVDLVAAALGCIACPLLLPLVGAGGVFLLSVLLGLVAAAVVLGPLFGPRLVVPTLSAAALCLVSMPWLDAKFPVPSKGAIDFHRSVESALKLGPSYSVWTANSRVDLVRVPKGMPALVFMRGSKTTDLRADFEWAGISQDATAGTMIGNYSDSPFGLEILERSLYSAAYRLKERPKVLVIGLGGGNDVWAAKHAGARSVKAIELNWPIVDIHQRVLRRYSRKLVEDPSVRMVVDEGRSALMRETERYDVVQMSGIDTWTALASGAYVLAENYLYTQEAIVSMYERLEPNGILQIARFAATMEALRLASNIRAALETLGVEDAASSLIALSTPDQMMAVQLKKGVFTAAEIASTRAFAEENGIELVYMPDRPIDSHVDELVRAPDPRPVIDGFPMNIEPTDDDRPYFFNYTKWQHPIESIERLADVPAVSQGNPFFLLAQLGVSIVLSVLLIVWPITRRGVPRPAGGLWRYLVYFAGLGLGFMFVEIAAIQKLTLLLGQPVYSLTVTLASLLVFTGLGSLRWGARFGTNDLRIFLVPGLLGVYVAAWAVGSPLLVERLIGLPLSLRIASAFVLLAPLGLLLGIPFAHGLRVLDARAPALTPWAWAINGCFSVVGSILTVVVSMNFGFAAVLWTAIAIYLAAFAALHIADSAEA